MSRLWSKQNARRAPREEELSGLLTVPQPAATSGKVYPPEPLGDNSNTVLSLAGPPLWVVPYRFPCESAISGAVGADTWRARFDEARRSDGQQHALETLSKWLRQAVQEGRGSFEFLAPVYGRNETVGAVGPVLPKSFSPYESDEDRSIIFRYGSREFDFVPGSNVRLFPHLA